MTLPDLARTSLPSGTTVVRVATLSGFGSRDGGEALAVAPDGSILAGSLLRGVADAVVCAAVAAGERAGPLSVPVDDPTAADAGLACGGTAGLLLHPADAIPPEAWEALRDGVPTVVALAADAGAIRAVVDGRGAWGSLPGLDRLIDAQATELFRAGRNTVVELDGAIVESCLPPSTLRIVGRAVVGDALVAQAGLLGWRVETVDDPVAAEVAGRAQSSHDALVVLSHDPDVDTPALAAVLGHGRGYVGALGSRRTQQSRRERLGGLGFSSAEIDCIHGPVGLDLGARSPAETAVAIVAEVIAHRAGRDARSLHAGSGPINT